MTKQLYIKTDGPITEDCDYITAGRVYEVRGGPEEGSPCGLVEIIDDNGFDAYLLTNAASCGERCAYLAEGATWHFCDQHGNPVPAPWEGEAAQQHYCDNCLGIDPESCMFNKLQPINWQAHAEALAEALRGMLFIVQESSGVVGYHLNGALTTWGWFDAPGVAESALAAFDQARGKV